MDRRPPHGRTILPAAVGSILLLVGLRCAHKPCPATLAMPAASPSAPADAETFRAVEQAGFRYERCPNRGSRYRLSRAGGRDLTFDELRTLKTNLLAEVQNPGLTGIGACDCEDRTRAPGAPPLRLCVAVFLREGDLDPQKLATLVSWRLTALGLEDVTAGVRVDLHAKPGPRCVPEDPACGPLPLGGKCLADVGYVAGRARRQIFKHRDGGECAHDGECQHENCESCFTTRDSDRYSYSLLCFSSAGMKSGALCGCVSGSCTWFVQAP